MTDKENTIVSKQANILPQENGISIAKINQRNQKGIKETFTKKLELEEQNFRIESNQREETEISLYDEGTTKVKVKTNPNGEKEVIEYLEEPVTGEQLFVSYDVFVREACAYKKCRIKTLEKRYLLTEEKLIALAGPAGEASPQYMEFFAKYIQIRKRGGYFIPRGEKLGRVGVRLFARLAGGKDVEFTEKGWKITSGGKSYGFSGVLLK